MKTLKKFEFKPSTGVQAKYNWDKLLDGGIYHLEEGKGKDYECATQAFRNMAVRTGAKRGLHVETQSVKGGVVIHADRKLTNEEKAEWDASFAELKAKGVERRKTKKAAAAAAAANGDTTENDGDEELSEE